MLSLPLCSPCLVVSSVCSVLFHCLLSVYGLRIPAVVSLSLVGYVSINVDILACKLSHDHKQNKKNLNSVVESASELYRPSDRRLSAKLVPTFPEVRRCHVVSMTDPYGRILGFLGWVQENEIRSVFTEVDVSLTPLWPWGWISL
jgi:hypothetical protein